MKRFFFAFLLSTICMAVNANEYVVTGCIVDEKEEPVEYATVVFLQGEKQMGGTTTNEDGCFNINVLKGTYDFKVTYVGMKPYESKEKVEKNLDLGKIKLTSDGVVMQEVTVTASTIRREADRFVMQVEDQPITIGKNGEELLKQAPGVWITDDAISINGKSGTKIYINDREQNMSNEQLISFLKSLSAEDISKIEVIPQAGAEYSADTSSGIIKIYTRKIEIMVLWVALVLLSVHTISPRKNRECQH